MKKIYRIKGKTSVNFTLATNGGKLRVGYQFKDGNPMMNIPAKLALDNEFAQDLLESSPLFKNHVVELERVVKEEVKKDEDSKLTPIKNVTNVAQAVDYIANTYGVAVKTTMQAVDFARKHGFEFVDLKTKEK